MLKKKVIKMEVIIKEMKTARIEEIAKMLKVERKRKRAFVVLSCLTF
jgi:hypothetical protein